MMECEKDKIDWVWDKCIDINDNYNPNDGFKELKQLLSERKKARTRRRFICLSMSAAAALLLLIAFLPKFLTINDQPEGKDFSNQNLALNEKDFLIKIGRETYVNMFRDSRMYVKNNAIVFRNGKKEEMIAISGKEEVQIKVPTGMRYSVTLEDGSKIWTTSNSVLSFPSEFSGKERRIKAIGRLFFEIEKANIPFIVDLKNDLSIIVYGTVFNVESYFDSNKTKICLTEGKVSLKIGENENLLLPNQSLLYDIEKKTVSTKDMDSCENIFWKDGCIYFNDVSLENLAEELSRWFNVSVCFHTERIKTLKFSGNIPDNLELEEIIEVLNAARTFRSEYKDGVIHFYKY
ncbi:MAG: FecR domain-containing protein [Rikenellaceae bacterium]